MIRAVAVAAFSSVVFLCACPSKPAAEGQLPPAGLAGSPSTGAPLTLPGAGVAVADPSGGTPSSTLPPGHPPIDGANAGAPSGNDGDNGLPAGHPPIDGANTGGGAMAGMAAMPGMGVNTAADPGNVTIVGPVLETMDVPEYTYMRVKTSADADGVWCAVQKTPVAIGDVVTVNQSLVMPNFFSKGLNRTFPKLVMGMLIGTPKKPG